MIDIGVFEPLLPSETMLFILPTIPSCEWDYTTLLAGNDITHQTGRGGPTNPKGFWEGQSMEVWP